MLALLLPGSSLVAERRFAFQERPATAFPQGSHCSAADFLRPIPREVWQLFDVVIVLLENAGTMTEVKLKYSPVGSAVPSLKPDR